MKNMKLEVIYLPTDALTPYENNAKLHPQEQIDQIKKSITEFGMNDPIAVWGENNLIVEGHGRLIACQQLGFKEVPVIRLDDLTEDERKAYTLTHNKLTMNTGFDEEMLKIELGGIDFDMGGLGFDLELEELNLNDDAEIIEDEVPEPPAEPKTRLGDIYKLGDHRLMCGDSTDEATVALLMDGQKVDLVFTDPPYELETQGGGIFRESRSMTQIKTNRVDKFDPAKIKLWARTNIFFHNKPLIKKYIELSEKNNAAYDLAIYKKQGLPNYKGHLMTDIEYIAIVGEQNPNQGLSFEEYSKVYEGKKDSDNELSYSKPVGICAKFIKLYSRQTVLDLFGGSGSTLIACEQTGRKCYMMELDPKYCDVIIERWEKLTGKKAEKIGESQNV